VLVIVAISCSSFIGAEVLADDHEPNEKKGKPPSEDSIPIHTRRLPGQFADYVNRAMFQSLLDEHSVAGEQITDGKSDPRFPEYKKRVDDLLVEIFEMYRDHCKQLGLPPPVKPNDYPPVGEISNAVFFDAYHYAQAKVASRYLDCESKRKQLYKRWGRRVIDLVKAQTPEFEPQGDLEDLMDMRKWLEPILNTIKGHRMVVDIGTIWPKGTYKRWREEGVAEFKLWMTEPVALNASVQLDEEEHMPFADLVNRVVEAYFAGYLVDAREVDFRPSKFKGETKIKVQWELASLL